MNNVHTFIPRTPIPPKTETGDYEGHRYVLTYHPAEPDETKRWSWWVAFRVCYDYMGAAASIERARKDAQRKIKELREGKF